MLILVNKFFRMGYHNPKIPILLFYSLKNLNRFNCLFAHEINMKNIARHNQWKDEMNE